MDDNSQTSFLADIVGLLTAYIRRVNDLIQLAILETKLAVKTLLVIAVLIFILGSILTGLWLSLLALVFLYVISLHYSLLTAGSVIVLLNVAALATIFLVIYKIKANLFFPRTCSQLNYNNTEGYDHARITTENSHS